MFAITVFNTHPGFLPPINYETVSEKEKPTLQGLVDLSSFQQTFTSYRHSLNGTKLALLFPKKRRSVKSQLSEDAEPKTYG